MNKSILFFSITFLLLSGCNNLPNKEGNQKESEKLDSPNTSNKTPLLKKYILIGSVTNTTINKKGSVEMEITEIAPNKFKCTGKFDEETLFGRFNLYGEKYENPNLPNALSIKFNGQIHLGDNDGSGFSPGTKTTFFSNLNIFNDNVTGEYLLDEILDSRDNFKIEKQNGLYSLKIKSKIKYIETD